MAKRIFTFLIINFVALGIGSVLMNDGPKSDWYLNLNHAPWTPPGAAFGIIWSIVMVCFAVYMAKAYEVVQNESTLTWLFIIQWILNVGWNPAFFHFQHVTLGLVIIILLTLVVGYMFFRYLHFLKLYSLLLLPYLLWLLVATSLNAYILMNN